MYNINISIEEIVVITHILIVIRQVGHFYYELVSMIKVVCGSICIACLASKLGVILFVLIMEDKSK